MNSNNSNNLPSPAIGAITSMVERRNQAKAFMEEAIDLIAKAQALAPEYTFEYVLAKEIPWYIDNQSEKKAILTKALDRKCWEALLDQSKLGVVMNSTQLEQVRNEIEYQTPELTLNRAMTTFMDLFHVKEKTFREGLVKVFKDLSGKFKSHDVFKIKKRIILDNALSGYHWSHRNKKKDIFNDVWHYLYFLDGNDPTEVAYDDQPANIISAGHGKGISEFEFEQFRVVTYQKGSVHIWLDKRPDLIDKVNGLIAEYYGQTLPG